MFVRTVAAPLLTTSTNATDHNRDHRHVNHRLTARREVLVVFAQPTVFSKPAEGTLNDPSV